MEQSYDSNGRHGIDNLSFNQVPEPSTVGLLGIAGLALASRRRSR
ncbi:MAG: PEP-CTERM sorting domain-containing protein, partial [Hymenobacter sp.]